MQELVVQRVKHLTLAHFRGFVGDRAEWDTDADLVLLLGPNGTGKTSFIEAIQLLLTGVPMSRGHGGEAKDGYASLLALRNGAPAVPRSDKGAPARYDHFELEARVSLVQPMDGTRREATLQVTGTKEGESGVRLRHTSEGCFYPADPFPERALGTAERAIDGLVVSPRRALPDADYAAGNVSQGAALQARLTSFFQHDVARVFDDAAQGRTVLDLVAPIPARIRHLSTVLEWVREAIEARIAAEGRSPEKPTQEDPADLQRYRDALEELLVLVHPVAPALLELPQGSDATGLARAASEMCERWGVRGVEPQDAPQRLSSILENQEPKWRQEFERLARGSASEGEVRDWQAELEQLRAALETLRVRRPGLAEEAAAFHGAVVTRRAENGEPVEERLPNLLHTLRALQQGLQGWSESARRGWGPRPARLKEEFAAVRRDALGAFVAELEDWTKALEHDLRRQREQEQRRSELEKKLLERTPETEALSRLPAAVAAARKVPQQAWRRLMDWEAWTAKEAVRNERMAALWGLQEDVKRCGDHVDGLRAYNPSALKQLERSLNEVSRRFSIVGNREIDLRVEEATVTDDGAGAEGKSRSTERLSARTKPSYADGRGLSELSSGQKSQLAVGFLIAQNLLVAQGAPPLDRGMPHRVLLLDDVSSTYDLTNLMRESILWRQLAYTDEPKLKRQIFLSSHHEDLTNQLLDHLVPPRGFTMRVLRFKDWRPDTGPMIESFEVEPARRLDDSEAIQAFQTNLEALFHGG